MNAMTAIAARKEKGFTLIELVMVIVILGILAAFALPRFADLSGDAERATLDGARGSVKSAIAIVRSKALAQGVTSGTIDLDGAPGVVVSNGHLADESIEKAAQLGDYFVADDYSYVATSNDAGKPCFNFTPVAVDATTEVVTPPSVGEPLKVNAGEDACE